MTPRQEAKNTRHRLKGAIVRAHRLHLKCLEMVADGDLPTPDRETAEHRSRLAFRTAKELEAQLTRLDEMLA